MSALFRSARSLSRAVRASAQPWRACSGRTGHAGHAGQGGVAPLLRRLDDDVRRYGRLSRRDLDELQRELKAPAPVSSTQSLLILRCCGSLVQEEIPTERTRFVHSIWKTLSDRKVPMDISHYNALLRVYIENDHKFSTDDFLKDLESNGLEPNRVTYQRLMWHRCQLGDVEGASKILELMKEKKLPLSDAVLDALVLGHVRQDNLEGAHSVLTAMSEAGLNPTAKTYSILMGGSAKRGDIDRVKQLIEECEGKEIYLSDKDFLDVLEEFAIGGHNDHVSYVIDLMQKSAGYNQEAINVILRLLNREQVDAAFLLLQSMTRSTSSRSDDTPSYQSAFFIKQLIKSNLSTETILSTCDRLERDGNSPRAKFIATEAALSNGNIKLSLALFKSLQSSGNSIKQHFFWPLFVAKGKSNDVTGMLDVLRLMGEGYDVPVATETLKDYVVPHLIKKRDPAKIVELIRESGIPLAVTVRGTLLYLIMENKLKEAADLAGTYGTRGNLKGYINSLVSALHKSNDVESFVKIVTLACSNDNIRRTQDEEEPIDRNTENREALGKLLNIVVSSSTKEFNRDIFPTILEKFLDNGLGITAEKADEIQKRLGEIADAQTVKLLSMLVSDELKIVEVEKGEVPQVRRTPFQLQSLITTIEARGENADNLKRQYLSALIRNKEYEKVEEALQKYEETNVVLNNGTNAFIMDMYTQLGNIEKSLKYREIIKAQDSDFILDSLKVVRLAQLMINKEQFDQAVDLLLEHKPNKEPEINFIIDSVAWQILSSLAETGDVEKTNTFFKVLEQNKYVKVTNVLLGPLVKVHINAGNMKEALNVFEECTNKYHSTPYKGELNKKLILDEDAEGLQRITDLSTLVHGEVNSLYDLVFGFIECGRVKQARRILQTPGMRTKNHRFNSRCERYREEGKVDCLENLLEATCELAHIDRLELFQQLLRCYVDADEPEKAMGLWTLLQEENISPSDKFLNLLANYLDSKNINVPFVRPSGNEEIIENQVSKAPIRPVITSQTSTDSNSATLKSMIDDGEIDKAGEYVLKTIKAGKKYQSRLLKLVISKLAINGNVALLEDIGVYLNDEQQRSVSFENRRCEAIARAGLSDEYLAGLEAKIDSAKDEDLSNLEIIFPKGGILMLLSLNPNSYKQVYVIAEKYASRGIKSPMNSLWIYNILRNKDEEAKNIWTEHLINVDKILFRSITRNAENEKNVNLISKLLNYLKDNPNITPKTLASVYSIQINILLDLNQPQEANDLLKSALSSNVSLNDFHKDSLTKLKSAVEYSGKQFEYST